MTSRISPRVSTMLEYSGPGLALPSLRMSTQMRLAFTPLLKAEQAEFGVEKWTAKSHAAYIRRYFDGR